jgi:hepatocyte growth factor-regulated tyrosine kinase substrate
MFGTWSTDPFAELVEKATSELLPQGQEDIALNLEVSDKIKSKSVPAKQAMQTIRKRLAHKNPNVVLLALGVSVAVGGALSAQQC